jgi:DNA-binding MarR family transcriptional regulator
VDDRVLDWVERVAMYLARDGVAPIAGRVLGWLMICDPPEQSAAQISEAVGASRASLTTNIRMLITMGLVSKRTRPRERTTYYRVAENAWANVIQRQVSSLVAFGEITRDGLDLLGPDRARAARIQEAHDMFRWLAEVFDNAPRPPASQGE